MRLIQSIFSGGKTGSAGGTGSGFSEEELAQYQQSLMRGAKGAGAGGNPVMGAAGGLLGEMARKKFFPTDEEEASKVVSQAQAQVAQTIDPSDTLNFNREVIGLLGVMAKGKNNSVLTGIISEGSLKIKDAETKKEKDRIFILDAQTKLNQDRQNLKTSKDKEAWDAEVRMANSKGFLKQPEKIIEAETKFRLEYKKKWDEYSVRKNAFTAMLDNAAVNTKSGDLALMIGYFKTLDPTSAVLTGEVDLAKHAQELGGLAETAMNAITSGSGLPEKLKQELAQSAGNSINAASGSLKVEQDYYAGLAERKGFNVDNVVYGEALQVYKFNNEAFNKDDPSSFGKFEEVPLPEGVTVEKNTSTPDPIPDTSDPKPDEVVTANNNEPVESVLSNLGIVTPPQEDEENNQ